MSSNFKSLKKLADTCRKAGIKHYKCAEFEFTLTEDGPISNYKKRTTVKLPLSTEATAPAEELSDEQLLFWSLPDPESKDENTQ